MNDITPKVRTYCLLFVLPLIEVNCKFDQPPDFNHSNANREGTQGTNKLGGYNVKKLFAFSLNWSTLLISPGIGRLLESTNAYCTHRSLTMSMIAPFALA